MFLRNPLIWLNYIDFYLHNERYILFLYPQKHFVVISQEFDCFDIPPCGLIFGLEAVSLAFAIIWFCLNLFLRKRNNEDDLIRVTEILKTLPSRTANLQKRINIPECPVSYRFFSKHDFVSFLQVCFEPFGRNTSIYNCINGHFICNDCKMRMATPSCPKCKQTICGRATDFENYLNELLK